MQYSTINTVRILSAFLLCGSGVSALAVDLAPGESMSEEEIEVWFNDDSEEKAQAVNEGNLEFLLHEPVKAAHHLHNRLILDSESLATGWIDLIQCHTQLDAVPDAQIVYRYRRMKNLRIESSSGITRAWIEGDSVQLENIKKDARLCVRAEVAILNVLPDGGFILKNGPFHRKFLDGYYPMQVTLQIHYPSEFIRFESLMPQVQPGLTVSQEKGELHINARFEGELTTEIRFTPVTSQQ